MDLDPLKKAWQAQAAHGKLVVDTDLMRAEVRRSEQFLSAIVFWRDVREIAVCVVLIPVWIAMGVAIALPWTWYLAIPALLFIAGFMLVDRRRHHRPAPGPEAPLIHCVEHSLGQVEHQIWLLRNVFWWYLLPLAVPILAFLAQVCWRLRSLGWQAAVFMVIVTAFVGLVFVGVYRLNQRAVRSLLEPRRRELQALLASLRDSVSDLGESST